VIAVTQGKCWGGGFQIALGADFRFSHPDCSFAIMETRWGLIPDMGASILLRELMPIDAAKELTMTARIINAREAKELNLITRICADPMAEAEAWVDQIRDKSPDAIVAAKRLYTETWFASVRRALDWETKMQKRLIGRHNQRAAISRADTSKPAQPFRDRR
jgi:enoyl-CoA hydratase/carnithine racemase